MNNLRRLDLNLLVTLDVLLAEHNVTRAAERLNFSQPSVSVHLAKLREIFGDPCCCPVPAACARRHVPRSCASRCARPAGAGTRGCAGQPVRPAAAQDVWRVAATDYGESAIVLPVLSRLRSKAPGTRLAVVEMVPARIARQAEQGDIDLSFHTAEGSPPGLRRRTLFTERYVLAGRVGHPS